MLANTVHACSYTCHRTSYITRGQVLQIGHKHRARFAKKKDNENLLKSNFEDYIDKEELQGAPTGPDGDAALNGR